MMNETIDCADSTPSFVLDVCVYLQHTHMIAVAKAAISFIFLCLDIEKNLCCCV